MTELSKALYDAVWHELCRLNTCLPAVVNSYDPAKVLVEVQPLLKKVFLGGQAVSFKPICDVPVVFSRTNRFRLTFPLERGDTGMLLFGQRSLAEWLTGTGKEMVPADSRKFALTDAIFVPGLFAFGKGNVPEDGSKFELAFDDVKIVSDGNTLELNGATDSMVKEGPLNDILSDLVAALTTWAPVPADGGAALKLALATFLSTAPGKIAQLASVKNKLG